MNAATMTASMIRGDGQPVNYICKQSGVDSCGDEWDNHRCGRVLGHSIEENYGHICWCGQDKETPVYA